ncbi:MAG: hypothetical protein PVJ84_18215 [Desulfobacteraceae bacterium]
MNDEKKTKDSTTVSGARVMQSMPSVVISSITTENNIKGAFLDQQYNMIDAAKIYFWNALESE